VYETFFKPYIAKHETEIDRNLLEFRTRAGDMAVVYFQRVANYVQTRSYEILQYIASQSPSQRPRPQVLLPWLPFLPAIRNILATRVVTPAMRSMYVPKCSLPSTWSIKYLSSSSVWHSFTHMSDTMFLNSYSTTSSVFLRLCSDVLVSLCHLEFSLSF